MQWVQEAREISVNSTRKENVELAIWKEIASEHLSVSHDRWHIDRVLSFASQLQSLYGGDLEVLMTAVILHDLGRADRALHEEDSVEESVERARAVLERTDFPPDKIEQVLVAIAEHDKPGTRPSTVEGRILKDADFLGGFGAWGILRIGMWAGEVGRRTGKVLNRLEERMIERLNNMEFVESRRWAHSETLFARLFLAQLQKIPNLFEEERLGMYIVLEGVSGTGKNTQRDLLRTRLEHLDYKVVPISEPAELYHEFRDLWESKHKATLEDPTIRRFLLLADRYKLIEETVNPALREGSVVLSARSFISFIVYQCYNPEENCYDADELASAGFAHQFVPLPDLIVLYDIDPDEAYSRIRKRGRERGRHETLELLSIHRNKYLDIIKTDTFCTQFKVIDAGKPVSQVADETWMAVEEFIDGRKQQSGQY